MFLICAKSITGLLMISSIPMLFAAPPASTYKTITGMKTVHGVQYWAGHPADYSPNKKYFICINHSGAGPITHHLYSTGDLYGYGESVGFNPIYLAIDYGTEGTIPGPTDPLWARYYEAISDIKALYPNTYPGIFMTGFSAGAAFVSAYAQHAVNEKRLVAISPNSSGNVVLPKTRDRNYIKVLFTCGTSDGNIDGMIKAVPIYQSFGYDCRLFKEQGVTHMVGDASRMETVKYFKWVVDSLMKVMPPTEVSYRVLPVDTKATIGNDNSYFTISGRVARRDVWSAPAMVVERCSGRRIGFTIKE